MFFVAAPYLAETLARCFSWYFRSSLCASAVLAAAFCIANANDLCLILNMFEHDNREF